MLRQTLSSYVFYFHKDSLVAIIVCYVFIISSYVQEFIYHLGNKSFHNGDINSATEYYSLGLIKSPNDSRILNNRAECYLQNQLPHLALADCERILDICKNNSTDDKIDMIFTWKVQYRKVRALIGLQLYDQAKLLINSLLECTQDILPTYSEIIDRFRRILDTDIPRLQNEAQGNYDVFDLMTKRTRKFDEFYAEFERKEVLEFRQCDKPVSYVSF